MLNTRLSAVVFFAVSSIALAQNERRGPPAESLSACAGLTDGTACGFTIDGKNLTGTCRTGPNKEAAACLPEGGRGRHHGPPPQALEACKGLSANAACTVSFGDKSVTGTCAAGGPSNELACRPADSEGRGHHHGPPPEARTACENIAVGAACSVTIHEKTLSGTCRRGPNGEAAACMPARPQ